MKEQGVERGKKGILITVNVNLSTALSMTKCKAYSKDLSVYHYHRTSANWFRYVARKAIHIITVYTSKIDQTGDYLAAFMLLLIESFRYFTWD